MSYHYHFYTPIHVEKNGMATASMVIGIIALVLSFIPIVGIVSWILSPVGLVFCGVAWKNPLDKDKKKTGLITNGIALGVCLIWFIWFASLM